MTVRPKKDEEAGCGLADVGAEPAATLLLAGLGVVSALALRAEWPVEVVTWAQPISVMSAIVSNGLRDVLIEDLGENRQKEKDKNGAVLSVRLVLLFYRLYGRLTPLETLRQEVHTFWFVCYFE
jgi:hypothetical protein